MYTPHIFKKSTFSIRITTTLIVGIISALLHVIRIPLPGTPVPFVLQPLPSFFSTCLLGPWYGLASQLIAISILPFTLWAPLGGISMLWGATSGYIWGFVFVGTIAHSFLSPHRTWYYNSFIMITLTFTCLHLPGMCVLRTWYFFAGVKIPSWSLLLHQAIIPFIIGDTLKAVITALFYRSFNNSERSL